MSNKEITNRRRFTMPGEKLGVIEEFLVGPGTYEKDGTLYSAHIGYALVNPIEKTVKVEPFTSLVIPKEEDEIIGLIVNVQDRLAIAEIYIIESRVISIPFSASIHIANSSPRYEPLMNELYKRGDFVKAKIINVKNRIPQLTTVDEKFGVVKAFCSQCGEILNLRGRILVCHVCGNREHRKVAQDYDRIRIGGTIGDGNIKRK